MWGVFLLGWDLFYAPGLFTGECIHCTCLGFRPRAACGGSSAGGNGRESRTLPDSKEISSAEWLGLFLCPRGALSPGPSPGGCIHRTWLGFQLRAALWDRSRAPPVAEAARRSVGNRKERLRDYASSPDDTAQLETAGAVNAPDSKRRGMSG